MKPLTPPPFLSRLPSPPHQEPPQLSQQHLTKRCVGCLSALRLLGVTLKLTTPCLLQSSPFLRLSSLRPPPQLSLRYLPHALSDALLVVRTLCCLWNPYDSAVWSLRRCRSRCVFLQSRASEIGAFSACSFSLPQRSDPDRLLRHSYRSSSPTRRSAVFSLSVSLRSARRRLKKRSGAMTKRCSRE